MYPPGNQHIPPWEKENNLQNAILGGYVSSLERIWQIIGQILYSYTLLYMICLFETSVFFRVLG